MDRPKCTSVFNLILLSVSAFTLQGVAIAEDSIASKYDVRILRDTWGVPHIFGKTDADAAFGLAYAHSEDDFKTMQGSLLTSRGQMGLITGASGATTDFIVHLLGVKRFVEEKYETDLSPEMRAVLEAYADGVTFYAQTHPEEIITDALLPITGKDIVGGFVFRAPFFFGLDRSIRELFGNERRREVSEKRAQADAVTFSIPEAIASAHDYISGGEAMASNSWSVGPGRTADGSTFLLVNPHLAWEGPTTWYEVHVHSEEGWDMTGGLFPGSPVVTVGHNRNLGWSHTVNSPDLVDIYVLETNPDNPDQYKFDGEWLDFEIEEISLRVKITDAMSMPVRRELVQSVHGPVIRNDHGVYAIRYAGRGDIRSVEQWFRMNKARNLDEWMDAMRMRAIHSFNTIYGDREGNIYCVYNAMMPIRAEGYDYAQYLPGNTSETLWTSFLPYDKLPQVLNPPSAFVQNCNSSPFHITFGPGNPNPDDYSPTFGIESRLTNRTLRALELHAADDSITYEEFHKYKFDMKYSKDSYAAMALEAVLSVPEPEDALGREALAVLRTWDLGTDPGNRSAALGVLSFRQRAGQNPDPDKLLNKVREVAATLKEFHGRIDVEWQEVNRLQRGDLDVGLGGGPDILHCITGRSIDGGARTVGRHGDGHTMLVAWDKDGNVTSRSMHQYGTATMDESSPHYADQVPLIVERRTKPVWMDEADIRANLEREYRPGEE